MVQQVVVPPQFVFPPMVQQVVVPPQFVFPPMVQQVVVPPQFVFPPMIQQVVAPPQVVFPGTQLVVFPVAPQPTGTSGFPPVVTPTVKPQS
jgi:hypothetical protein